MKNNNTILKFGELAYNNRVSKGLTQRTVAELVDIDISNYTNIENSKCGCRLETAIKISNVLDFSLGELKIES